MINILHLEDNPRDAELVKALLQEEGFEFDILIVASQRDFIEAMSTRDFDVILCDFSLPAFDGMAALKISKEKLKDVPFIFISGTIGEDRAIAALLEGATDYVLKDRIRRLGPAIHRALAERDGKEARRQLELKITQSHSLEMIGTLAGGVAHDFNNILGIIMGHASIMQRATGNPEVMNPSLDAILKAVDRGAALVRQLLTIAQKKESSPQLLNIDDEVKEFLGLLRGTFPKNIKTITQVQQFLRPVFMNQTHFHQILLNLSINARDAMPQGGELTFRFKSVHGLDLREKLPTIADAEYILIEVIDTGIGMDESTRTNIFEPFFTTKEKGTGLGLATTIGIIQKYQGFVKVESSLGIGTKFMIYLPASKR